MAGRVGCTAGRRKCGLLELLFSGPLVALRCGGKISPGLGCMVPCLYDKDMCVSGVMYYECYNVVTWGGSPISRKCMWLWTHLCIPSVIMYPFCLGILESVEYCGTSVFPVAVSLRCVLMRLVASISSLRHCTAYHPYLSHTQRG